MNTIVDTIIINGATITIDNDEVKSNLAQSNINNDTKLDSADHLSNEQIASKLANAYYILNAKNASTYPFMNSVSAQMFLDITRVLKDGKSLLCDLTEFSQGLEFGWHGEIEAPSNYVFKQKQAFIEEKNLGERLETYFLQIRNICKLYLRSESTSNRMTVSLAHLPTDIQRLVAALVQNNSQIQETSLIAGRDSDARPHFQCDAAFFSMDFCGVNTFSMGEGIIHYKKAVFIVGYQHR